MLCMEIHLPCFLGSQTFTFKFKLNSDSGETVQIPSSTVTTVETAAAPVSPPPVTPVRLSRQEEFSQTQPDPDYTRYWEEDQRRRQLEATEAAGTVLKSDTKNECWESTDGSNENKSIAAMDEEEIVLDSQDERDYFLLYPGSPINLGKCRKRYNTSKSPSDLVKRLKRS
ncbi:hypothetical protein EV421DRAFT_1912713 [Armillaria borealis]|uniref:Uncharacterized protein n=1 Tax=Armillaria borealis TaxID=47425 RepID=A0AA39ME88_9AGAR|nr:hypothetical protein EV421DRAFT_1912713 [Armillaria borealis]